MTFGSNLAELRRNRGWSQEALALRAGLSQRHISFLETGRAQPGQTSLRKLTQAMALKSWEQRSLLAALAPTATQTGAETGAEADDPALVAALVDRLSHWPAYAFRPDGTLVAQNDAMQKLLAAASPETDLWDLTAPHNGPNIYDIIFHPDGLQRFMINPEEVIPETMRRLRIEAAQDLTLNAAVKRLADFHAVGRYHHMGALPAPVLVERYQLNGEELAIISVLSHLASPGEPELDTLRIESFVPADAVSEAMMRRLISA